MNKCYLIEKGCGCGEVSKEDMELINSYSQKELTRDEIFCFAVLLCDNEIDRDFERFDVSSLEALSKLFVGKTAIKNHSLNSDDQSARTYKTELVRVPGKKNSLGEEYCYLKAYCYMPRLEKNAELIREIEAGIKKEVSIGCSVARSVCSICGRDRLSEGCTHKKGASYKNKLCFFTLKEPYDAYEWSFVAVPAQRNAGVTKSYNFQKEITMNEIVKTLREADGEVSLSKEKAYELAKKIEELSLLAKQGEEYRDELARDVVKLFAFTIPELSNDCTESICKQLTLEELRQIRSALKKEKAKSVLPQTAVEEKTDLKLNSFDEFRI